MINIILKSGKGGKLQSCSVSGHAGYASRGNDVVCAAVSTLVRVAVLQLQEWVMRDERLKVSLNCKDAGFVDFCVLQSDEHSKEALVHLFEFLKLGFESISSEYADFVKLEVC